MRAMKLILSGMMLTLSLVLFAQNQAEKPGALPSVSIVVEESPVSTASEADQKALEF